METKDLLILEPFYGGSHKQLIKTITNSLDNHNVKYDLFTLRAKKWPWKARCGAIMLSEAIPRDVSYRTLFCSSDLSLSEFVGIRPDFYHCHKVVYFHENQLVYPVQKSETLDFQFGYNQILTALAANEIYFNSLYNFQSFVMNINEFLRRIPEYKPKDIKEKIESKSKVLHFPLTFNKEISTLKVKEDSNEKILHIVWAHRWEYDKDPLTFFKTLFELQENDFKFCVSILGQGFTDVPKVFTEGKEKLKEGTIQNWGYVEDRNKYLSILQSCDVAISTAIHEFFGVSMMECCYSGCYPLCPNKLSYPEIYPSECLYNTPRQLYKKLREFCLKPWLASELHKKLNIDYSKYSWDKMESDYLNILKVGSKRQCT
ncbi:tRNA-queuosine alpha-mannosyltransferase-like [Styela clava]